MEKSKFYYNYKGVLISRPIKKRNGWKVTSRIIYPHSNLAGNPWVKFRTLTEAKAEIDRMAGN